MEKKNNISSEAAELRRKAEERLQKISKKAILPKTNEELLRLVHELQTHQIELEIINEELEDSKEDVEEGLQQYTDLYDFAPAGYFNLKRDGTVCRANLTGSSMLGVDRSKLMNSRFGLFISEETRPAFNELLQKVFESKIKTSCEVSLLKEGNELFNVHIDATAGIDGQECKMTMVDITGRKQAEEALQRSEADFKEAQRVGRLGSWDWDTTTNTIIWSEEYYHIFGFDPTQPPPGYEEYLKLYTPESAARLDAAVKKSMQTGEGYQLDLEQAHVDGTSRWISVIGEVKHDDKGQIVGLRGTAQDITERKRAEEEIAMLANSLRSINECVSITDMEDKLIFVNESFLKTYGYNENELIGKHISMVRSPNNPPELVEEILSTKLRGEWKGELWNKRKDGNEFPIYLSTTIVNDKDGKHLGLIGVATDITERKRAEEEIQNLAKFPSENPNPVLRIARDGTLLFVNESGVSLLVDWHLQIGKEAPQMLREAVFQSMHNVTTQVLDLEYGERVYSFYVTPIVAADYANLYGRDITEGKRAEKELIEAKEKAESANKLKDAFIANISHEIRTPLTGIIGMTSIIKETYQSNIKEEDKVLFEGIDISSNRIIRTIDMILNYSRLHVGEFNITPNKINISLICTNLVKEFIIVAKDKLLDLSFHNNIGDTLVFADEYSINMAISNLIDNAIKFTDKGFIDLILNKGTGDEIILEIKDTGIGINKEYLDHIFEPYRQEEMGYGRAYEGIGLGLAIVKKVFDLNNAVLTVESKKGEGTTFSINFGKGEQLLENKSKTVKAANILPVQEELQNKVVLLVEDDLMNQVTIRRFIENSYRVIITTSSDGAMEIIKKEKVDIILMDISIKGSRNGLELTKELKASKEFFHIPIIVVTAHAFESDMINSLAAGCDDYLAKPFSLNQLLNKIDKLVQSSYL